MTIDNPNPEITDVTPAVPEPVQEPVPTPANTPVSVSQAKNKQFTGRATQTEFERLTAAIEARKQPGQTYDVVRLALDMLDYIENDWMQTFKTK